MNSRIKLKLYFFILLTTLLTACGAKDGDSADSQPATEPAIYGTNVVGIAQFGLLKNATVTIVKYPLGGGRPVRAFPSENTTEGGMRKAGRFNTHSSELEDKVYYVYIIQDGEDIDPDGNGREDKAAFNNTGNVTGAIVRGEWLKTLGNKAFRITPLSDHIFNISDRDISNYSGLRDKLHATAKSLLKQDINGDGKLDMRDILVYNPLKDKAKIKDAFNDVIGKSIVFKQKSSLYYPNINNYKKIGQIKTETGFEKAQRSQDNKSYYLSTTSSGFHIFDVSDPYDMLKKGFIDKDFADFQVSSDNKKVYGAGFGGLTVVDISNPSVPTAIGGAGSVKDYRALLLSKDEKKVYAFTGRQLDILDVRNPSNILKISSIKMSFTEGFTFGRGQMFKSMDESKIYIGGQFGLSKMETFDVSNPAKPTSLGVLNYWPKLTLPEYYERVLTSDREYAYMYKHGTIYALKKP